MEVAHQIYTRKSNFPINTLEVDVFMKDKRCINCGSQKLNEFIDLGIQPNGNNFPTTETKDSEPLFHISMMVCEDCWQVQISEFPPQKFLFSNHPYITGVNIPVLQYFEHLVLKTIKKLDLSPNSLVLDIGCNDGSLLKVFQSHGMRVLGVDPGLRSGELAKSQGTIVCRSFWNLETGKAMQKLGLQPDLITATAVFYHLPDLHSFIEGLKQVMHKNSVFMVQCVNLGDLIRKNQFDHFYHEHSCIHSITALQRLFTNCGMRPLDVEYVDVHGGSFVLYVGLYAHPSITNESIQNALDAEAKMGLLCMSTYIDFADRVRKNAKNLVTLLTQLKEENKRVFALGAPVKGSTLLNYCNIGPDLVEYATEVNKFKIGLLTPGTHIPIVDEKLLSERPDYYLILCWNYLDYLISKYKTYLLSGGKFIIPVPEVRILSFQDLS
ncbi:MAG: class I SAM-dependent methyltransferase [Pseudanabaenales cyanobacterium]|nr:class I SAM-dependent methyltransferase [Pseudanabaenales cyanobacterium]